MPSPQFTFRLPAKDKAALQEMSKIYGSPSPGAFCAEVVGAMCSNDPERVKAFNTRLIMRAGEQLTLKLNSAVDAAQPPEKPAKKPIKRAKAKKTKVKGRKRA